jgi:hypothetical protein
MFGPGWNQNVRSRVLYQIMKRGAAKVLFCVLLSLKRRKRAAHGRLARPKSTICLYTYLVILQASSSKTPRGASQSNLRLCMEFEKFGKTYWHKNPRNIYIPHSVQYKYAEQPKECTGSLSM